MNADRWKQVKAIFNEAVEHEPPARDEFLRKSCGADSELQREVESLLASDSAGQASGILAKPFVEIAALAAAAQTREPSPLLGETLKDRYAIERELGRGGMSVVYLARDRELLSKRVVIKVLLKETSQDPWVRQKFQQEMEALARIDHPGVVGVLDTGLTADGNQFLVMQYIEGVTLRGVMETGGLNPTRAAAIVRQIGHALAAAHEKGVWHRDLKPENIMLQALAGEDHVKLIDFGIAGIQDSQFAGEKSKVAGSLTYMAPEQIVGKSCAASDTYALGVVAYEMLAGSPPGTQTRLPPSLPAASERCLLKAISYRPELRHASVGEFSDELYQALTSESPRRPISTGAVEIAHVLFTDLVGYSLLPMDQQKDSLERLQQALRDSKQFQKAEASGELINLPTGDGMALAFFGDPTAPAQCAVEIAGALKGSLKLRMGIHSGPVYRVADMNANANVAGGGINMAQRVMDCGDAGHILVSSTNVEVLAQLSNWSPLLKDLGDCTVKHGAKLHIFNLVSGEIGNAAYPSRHAPAPPTRRGWPLYVGLACVLAIGPAAYIWYPQHAPAATKSKLQYHVMVQKYRDGRPYEAPFRLSGERIFEAGYRVQLVLSGPAEGYLYVLNEGPLSTPLKPSLNTLGSTLLRPNEELTIPKGGFIEFDKEKGVEKLWVVWSKAAIPELEALRRWANPQDRGAIHNGDQASAVLALLKKFAIAKVEAKRDDTNRNTTLSGAGEILAYMIPLDHD